MKNTNHNQSKNYFYGLIKLILALVVLSGAANAGVHYVTNTNDSGFGSLRQAIIDANGSLDTHNTIEFSISGSGTKTINLQSPLPAIKLNRADCGFGNTLTIDATTMSGYAGVPRVELNGTSAGAASGLKVIWGIVTVKGLAINRFSVWGILVQHQYSPHNPQCAGNDPPFTTLKLYNSRIGTDVTGSQDLGNGAGGIYIDANTTAYIGGVAANDRNVISGNVGNGVELYGTSAYITGNSIGTNLSGTATIPNSFNGIKTDGGWSSIYNNVVSGNGIDGIYVKSPSHYLNSPKTLIQGNRIGTNDAGTADLGNTANGINVEGGDDEAVLIGGAQAWHGNVISGNNQNGILVKAERTRIQGNLIGTNAAGTLAVPNTQSGVYMSVRHSIVGGTESGEGNTISGNGGNGVKIEVFNDTYYADVVGNRIGTNSTATATLANGLNGVSVSVSVNSSFGYEVRLWQNVISGNTSHGVWLTDSAKAVYVYGNFIGTNSINANLGNGGNGVYAYGTAEDCVVESNTIAYNGGDGVSLMPALGGAGASRIKIAANSIYANTGLGIDLGPTNGVTPNDAGDGDAGPNGLQNFPVLQTATTTTVSGSLNSTPSTAFDIHFYRTDVCDASGNGEGRFYLGMVKTTSDASGNATFSANFALSAGQIVVATATGFTDFSIYGNTSEFSQCKTVIQTQPGNFSLGAATFNVNEGNGTLILGVNRTGGSDGTVTVNYATANGTAIAGQDYTATSGTLTFTPGQTVKNVTIPIINDPNDEPNQDFTFTLSSPTGGANLGNIPSAVITIIDNDNPPLVSINDVSVLEGNENLTTFTFDVSLSNASAFATSVAWATAVGGSATAGVDYQSTSGTVNFAAGETLKQVTVQVFGETLVEINETFNVNLSAPVMATVGDGNGVGTILDDDNPGKLSFSLAPYSGTEGNSVTVTVARTNGTAGTISVDYTTGSGTATPMSDYTPVSGSLIFAGGETTKTFTVDLLDDQATEPIENFNVVLSNPIGGATLGAPSTAAINILDNDSGVLHTIGGEIKKPDNSPLVGATVNLTGTQNATATTNAQGKFAFSNLAPNGNYSVAPAAIGFTFNPINRQYNNLSSDVANANFTATPAPSRQLRIVGGNATPGQNITATVELVAQGDENSVGFSLNFDSQILTNPQVALAADALSANLIVNNTQAGTGKLGIVLAMPAGTSFTAGTKSLITVTFNTLPTQAYNSPVTFGSVPVGKQIVNSNADPLPVNYLDGAVTFAQGWEADVTPRPMGKNNGSIMVTDFTQVGRFVAGLDVPNSLHNEFQRADCAPRVSLGNGALDVADFTQAGRYAAAIDAATSTGGQMAPRLLEFNDKGRLTVESLTSLYGENFNSSNNNPDSALTVVRVIDAQTSPGSQVFVTIETVASGTENGFGFTLNYDANKLSSPLVTKGADTATAVLIPNATQAGKVGIVMAMPFGEAIAAGTRQLVTVRFNVSPNAPGGLTTLTFSDAPVIQAVSDVNANPMQATFQSGAINILSPTSAGVSVGGRVRTVGGKGVRNALITITFPDGETRTALSNANGKYLFEDVPAGETYVITVAAKHYAFSQPSQIRQITEDVLDIDFVADLPGLTSTFTPR